MDTTPNSNTDEYIARFPKEVQDILQTLRKSIREELPKAGETISYGVPTFKLNGTYVVYFAGYAKHISIYPVFDSLEQELPEIALYRKGKGTLQFPLNKPLPLPLIRKVIKNLLKFNIERTSPK